MDGIDADGMKAAGAGLGTKAADVALPGLGAQQCMIDEPGERGRIGAGEGIPPPLMSDSRRVSACSVSSPTPRLPVPGPWPAVFVRPPPSGGGL